MGRRQTHVLWNGPGNLSATRVTRARFGHCRDQHSIHQQVEWRLFWRGDGCSKTQSLDRLYCQTDRPAFQVDITEGPGACPDAGETGEHPEIQGWGSKVAEEGPSC